jgi:hypothetical protein
MRMWPISTRAIKPETTTRLLLSLSNWQPMRRRIGQARPDVLQ